MVENNISRLRQEKINIGLLLRIVSGSKYERLSPSLKEVEIAMGKEPKLQRFFNHFEKKRDQSRTKKILPVVLDKKSRNVQSEAKVKPPIESSQKKENQNFSTMGHIQDSKTPLSCSFDPYRTFSTRFKEMQAVYMKPLNPRTSKHLNRTTDSNDHISQPRNTLEDTVQIESNLDRHLGEIEISANELKVPDH